ncbi:hybrid sensor histidine kinase/response regulator [Telluria aromaticivorans]|uniref:histidine kinase n=1 Tax=Telluria aromaticivorans TaxID=2725995 RepID=A0A7Y2JWI6_9BURK|nr:PAS domain-containing protein [Telluria aromaticivorans]NNG22321.1 PAS domain-containing protein [Telluria aromaticivorans]
MDAGLTHSAGIDRLAVLDTYGILDTPPERAFDDVALLLSQLLDAPIAAVNLIARTRQFFKAEIGLGTREMPLDDSICKFALLQHDVMVVPDTRLDSRFSCNPLVTGAPGLRFYAGALLKTAEGVPLGTLCALDTEPRPHGLTAQERFILETLAQQVMSQIELRKALRDQRELLIRQQGILQELELERDQGQRLLHGMDEGFVFLDRDFRVRQINAGGLKFETRAAADIIGLTHWEAWPGSEGLPMAQHYRHAMQERVPVNFEAHYDYPDGRSYWIDVRAYPANEGLAVFYRDITERKQGEEALRASQHHALEIARQAENERRRLDALLEAVPVGIIVADTAGAVIQVNAENRKIWGNHPFSASIDAYGEWKGWWADGSTRHGQPLLQHDWAMSRALAGEAAPRQIIEVQTFDASQQRRIVLNSGAPIRNETGAIIGAVVAQMDITDRVRAEEALRQADQRKDEFLAMLAHELRNPLAPITSAAAMLSIRPGDEPTVRRSSAIIARQAKHMTGLIDDLLDVSRVTRGKVELDNHVLDMRDVIADAMEQVRPLIERHAHHLVLRLPPAPAPVFGDRKRLVQVMTNLLSNAAKYTPDGGNIEVLLEPGPDALAIRVIDDGIGMTADLTASAFELFSQGARGLDRSQGGLGIGLALVKSLLQLHGGLVTVHSAGPGKGSMFEVTLPRLAGAPGIAGTVPVSHAEEQPGSLRIAVVDDNEDAAAMLAMYLESCGHKVAISPSAQHALERLPEFRPDVCLLDIGLPGMNGFELARSLRADPATAGATLIAITGYAQEQDRQDAISAGFDDLFAKPVDLDFLNASLTRAARRRPLAA